MSEEARAARGHRAQREMAEHEAAFQAVEAAIIKTLAETPVTQPDKVLKLHMAVQNLAAVRQALVSVIQDGQVAEYAIAGAGLTRPG